MRIDTAFHPHSSSRTDGGWRSPRIVIVGALAAMLIVMACATDDKKPAPSPVQHDDAPPRERPAVLSLSRIHEDPPLAGRVPMGASFSPDGALLAFLKGSDDDASVLDLWAIALPTTENKTNDDVKPGDVKAMPLVRTKDLSSGDATLSEEEKMALERKRIKERGITGYEWCGKSGRALLFPLDGQLFLTALSTTGDAPTTTALTKEKSARLDPTCDPKGERVSFVNDGDLFVVDVKTKKEERITKRSVPTTTNGVAEFIAQEEMGRYRGHWWSTEGTRLLFAEVDESMVGEKTRGRISAEGTELFTQRYPAAGEKNAVVKLLVRDIAKKKTQSLTLPADTEYVARAGFVDDDTVYAVVQTRDQKKVTLLTFDAPTFAPKVILEDTSDTFVELHDDVRFLKDGRVVWKREAPTAMNLVLIDDKGQSTALTMGSDPVMEISAVDEERGLIFYVRATELGRERQLFVTSLKGGDASVSQEKRVTTTAGTHSINANATGRFFLDGHSALFSPPKTTLNDDGGRELFVLEAGSSADWDKMERPPIERFTVAADDDTALAAVLIRPLGFKDGDVFPVLHYVYGGPHASVTQDRWGRLSPFFLRLAQRGYGVFLVDNRGSEGRDAKFRHSIFHRFGDIEVVDQKAGVTALKNKAGVDRARIAVFGWSYGGYLTARLMLDDASPYAGGIAVAPVTDWALYDTHYTERYLGTPEGNKDGYARSNLVTRASSLKGEFLLMHGLADDNVLFDHSLKLIDALVVEKKPFDLMAYPGKAHGIGGRDAQIHVFTMLERFLARTVGPGMHESSSTNAP